MMPMCVLLCFAQWVEVQKAETRVKCVRVKQRTTNPLRVVCKRITEDFRFDGFIITCILLNTGLTRSFPSLPPLSTPRVQSPLTPE